MEVLTILKDKLLRVKANINDLIAEVIEENRTLIEDLNIEQLQRGERADGTSLPNYSRRSVMVFGKPPGPIKLFDQGDFYRGITTKVFDKYFENIGTDSKTEKLKDIYGDNILGLSEESQDIIKATILLPELNKKIHNLLL